MKGWYHINESEYHSNPEVVPDMVRLPRRMRHHTNPRLGTVIQFEVPVTRTLLPSTVFVTPARPSRLTRCLVLIAPLLVFSVVSPVRGADPASALVLKNPGSLVIVGGGQLPPTVASKFLELAGGKRARLVVIPTAHKLADRPQPSASYLFWKSLGPASVQQLHTRDRKEANDPDFVKPLQDATGVWLGGGDQSKLTEAYLGTAVLRELRKVLERGGVVGGTSAGASVMSGLMITGGTVKASLDSGFGLVPGVVVDQHFTNRNRMGRLLSVLADHPDLVGLGLDESTAAVFHGSSVGVIGEASAFVCLTASSTLPVSVQRLKSGDQVDLISLSQTLQARLHGSSAGSTVTSAGSSGMREAPMSTKKP